MVTRMDVQPYLLEARQMQALSLGVHIPLVCFGIAFPAMVLFAEGLWLRTGVACLLAGIVLGAFAIATPGFIGELDDASERPHAE